MNANDEQVRFIARYAIHQKLASGGMATVHLGRLLGPMGFARTVAIKALHAHFASEPELVAMFIEEARMVSRIRHPNVVPTIDVVAFYGELFLVMDYVESEALGSLLTTMGQRGERMPVAVAIGICIGLLEGLHAAHEAKSEDGLPLGLVHRDVSPQNVIVGADGIPRVLDFGIAEGITKLLTSELGQFRGKLAYMAPELVSGMPADRRADVWSAAVVLWEMLVGRRLFGTRKDPDELARKILEDDVGPPSARGARLSPALDAVVARALAKSPDERFATAHEMALALEDAVAPASARMIAEWLRETASEPLAERAAMVEAMERVSRVNPPSEALVRTFAAAARLARS